MDDPGKKYKKADGTGKVKTYEFLISKGYKPEEIESFVKQGRLVEVKDEAPVAAAPVATTDENIQAPEKKKDTDGGALPLQEKIQTPALESSSAGTKNNSLYNNFNINQKIFDVYGVNNDAAKDQYIVDDKIIDLNKSIYVPIPGIPGQPLPGTETQKAKEALRKRVTSNTITKDDADIIAKNNGLVAEDVLKSVNTPKLFQVEKARKEFANLLTEYKIIIADKEVLKSVNTPKLFQVEKARKEFTNLLTESKSIIADKEVIQITDDEDLATWQNRIKDPRMMEVNRSERYKMNYEQLVQGTYKGAISKIDNLLESAKKNVNELQADPETSSSTFIQNYPAMVKKLQDEKLKITESYKIIAADIAFMEAGNNPATASQIYRKHIAPDSYDKEKRYTAVNRVVPDREQYENEKIGRQILLEGYAKKAEEMGGSIFAGNAPAELIDNYNKSIDEYHSLSSKYPQVEKNILVRAIEDEMGKRNSDFNTVFKGTPEKAKLLVTFNDVINDLGIADKVKKLGIDYGDIYENTFLSLAGRSFARTTEKAFNFLPRIYKYASGKLGAQVDAEMEQLNERRDNAYIRPDDSYIIGVPTRVDTKKVLPDGKSNPNFLKEVENEDKGREVFNANTIVGTMADVTGQMGSQILLAYAGGSLVKGALGIAGKIGAGTEAALATDIVSAAKTSDIHNKIGTFMAGYLTSYDDYKQRANSLITDEDGGDAARTIYAMWGASAQGASELILPEYKIARNIGAKFIENAPKIIKAISKEGLKDLSQSSFKQITKDIIYGALNSANVVAQENLEELSTNVSDFVADSFYAKPTDQAQDFAKDSWDTFLTTTIGTLPTAMLGFGGDVKNAVMSRSMQQKALMSAATDPSKFIHIVNNLYDAGAIDKADYNDKISIINTAARVAADLPVDDNGKKMNAHKKAVYVANRVAEEVLKEQLAKTTDDLNKGRIEASLKNLVGEREEILKGTVDYDSDLNPLMYMPPKIKGEPENISKPVELSVDGKPTEQVVEPNISSGEEVFYNITTDGVAKKIFEAKELSKQEKEFFAANISNVNSEVKKLSNSQGITWGDFKKEGNKKGEIWNNRGTKINEKGEFAGKDGKEYTVSHAVDKSGRVAVKVKDGDGETVSSAYFEGNGDGSYSIEMGSNVESKTKGVGLAKSIYDYVDINIGKIKKTSTTTFDGANLWVKNNADIIKRIEDKKIKNYSGNISLPEIQEQALQAPASLSQQLKDEELTTDLVARNTPEQINDAIEFQQNRLKEPEITNTAIEEIDEHIQLLEKGLEKNTKEGTKTNNYGNKKEGIKKTDAKEKGSSQKTNGDATQVLDDNAAPGNIGVALFDIPMPVSDKKNDSEFGNPVRFLNKKVKDINEKYDGTSFDYDQKINPIVRKQRQLEDKVKKAKGAEKIAAQKELDAIDTEFSEMQKKETGEQIKFENAMDSIVRHYAEAKIPGISENDIDSIIDDIQTNIFDNAGKELNWDKNLIDVIDNVINNFSSPKKKADENKNNSSRPEQGGQPIGSTIDSEKNGDGRQGNEKGQRNTNSEKKLREVLNPNITGDQQTDEGDAGAGTVYNKQFLNDAINEIGTPSVNKKLEGLNKQRNLIIEKVNAKVLKGGLVTIVPYKGTYIVEGVAYRVEETIQKFTDNTITALGFGYNSQYSIVDKSNIDALKDALVEGEFSFIETDENFKVENTQFAPMLEDSKVKRLGTKNETKKAPSVKQEPQSPEQIKKAKLDEAKKAFAASLKKSRGNLSVNPIDPELLANGVKLMAAYIDLGTYKFGEIVKDMAETLGEKSQDFLDAMKGVYGAYMAQNDIPEMDEMKTVRAFTVDDIYNENKIEDNGQVTATPDTLRTGTPELADTEPARPIEGDVPTEPLKDIPGQQSGLGEPNLPAATGEGQERPGSRGSSSADNTGTGGAGRRTGKSKQAITTTDPANKKQFDVKEVPENIADRDFVIKPTDELVPEGKVAKVAANMDAFLLLKQLEEENRNPTPSEKPVLAKFTGWGGLASYLEAPNYYENLILSHIIKGEELDTGYGSRKVELPAGEKMATTGQNFDQVAKNVQQKYNQLIKQYPNIINYNTESNLSLDKARQYSIPFLLTEAELQDATVSTENAHYTERNIITQLWDLARDLGFEGGKVIESSMGIGHFFGLMPEGMAANSDRSGVELDSITGRIAKKLYPESNIQVKGFQETNFKNNSFDLAISNVPFASTGRVSDEKNKDIENFSLHNYFIAKNLRLLKPGGIAVMITSKSTMDNASSAEARRWFNKPDGGNSELVGAIRLPNNALDKNAGTRVTTDILVFQKRKDNIVRDTNPFISTKLLRSKLIDGELAEIHLNEYFTAHPENMIGEMMFAEEAGSGGLYGKTDATLNAKKGTDILQHLKEISATFPKNILDKNNADNAVDYSSIATNEKQGRLFEKGGKFYISAGEEAEPAVFTKPAQKIVAKDYIGVRDAIQDIIAKEQQLETTDEDLVKMRAVLNKKYDAFVKKHGSLAKHNFLYSLDIDYSIAAAVENVDKKTVFEGNKTKRFVEVTKAEIFNKRINFPRTEPKTATDITDAIKISVAYRNHVNTDYIANLLSITPEQAKASMVSQNLVFENPENGLLEVPEEYLSGNVRKKLQVAENTASEDAAFLKNIDALKAVVPEDLPASVIGFKMGVAWLPTQIYKDFIEQTLGVNLKLTYLPQAGRWVINDKDGSGYQDTRNTNTYAVGSTTGLDIVKDIMNNKATIITREERLPDGGKKIVRDEVATASANDMQNKVIDEFTKFVKTNESYRQVLEKNYNEKFNAIVERKFNMPVFETFPGANPDIKLRQHQKKAALRSINENTYLAHSVGTGKTYTMATTAMEMRRLGTAKKPLIAVHNATVNGFANQFLKLYPGAKLLISSTLDKGAENRRKFFGKIASGDWDAIIIPQSQLTMIPDNPERVEQFINQKIDEIKSVLDSIDSTSKGEFYIKKQLEKEIEALQGEIDDLYDDTPVEFDENGEPIRRGKKIKGGKSKVKTDAEKIARIKARIQKQARRRTDNVLNFDQLGVDAIFIDEAHEYKKLGFSTGQQNIRGIDVGASKRALSALLKIRSVKDRTGGKNIIMASGTPITNTMAEAWTAMRFIAPEMLEDMGIQTFDQFSATFADIIPNLEQNAGGKFEVVSRLAKFKNTPELIAAFRKIADVVTNEDVPEYVSDPNNAPPQLKDGKINSQIVPITDPQKRLMRKISDEYAKYKAMSGKDKKEKSWIPLVLFRIGQKAAIDLRLVYPDGVDDPGSKVNKMIKNVVQNYFEFDQYKGTQMIFSDSFNSIKAPSSKALLGIANSENEFNLYADIKKKLIESGIPENEIIVLTDAKFSNKETKQKYFDMMNDGAIRIAIGSTDKMGVGVNAHERMISLHHVDAPPRPDQFEQRNGRILRPGNMFTKLGVPVNIYSYGVENTRDATAFDRLKTKQNFINQIMKGKVDSRQREIDDPFGEENANTDDFFAEMGATLSGSKHAMHLIFAEKDLRTERNREFSFEQKQIDTNVKLRNKGYELQGLKESLIIVEKEAKLAAEVFPDGKVKEIVLFGKTYKEKFAEPIQQRITEIENKLIKENKQTDSITLKINGLFTTIDVNAAGQGMEDNKVINWFRYFISLPELGIKTKEGNSARGLLQVLNNLVDPEVMQGQPERYRNNIERETKNIARLEADLKEEYDYRKLRDLEEKVNTLKAAVLAESAAQDKKEKEEREAEKNAGDFDIADKDLDQQIQDAKDDLLSGDDNLYGMIIPIPPQLPKLLKLAFLYARKGLKTVGQFAKAIGAKINEVLVKAWNQGVAKFNEWYYVNSEVPKNDDIDTAEKALNHIITNKNYYSELAKQVLDYADKKSLKVKIEVLPTGTEVVGRYKPFEDKIEISENNMTDARILLHEVVHAATYKKLSFSGLQKDTTGLEYVTAMNKAYYNPGINAGEKELHDLYFEAAKELGYYDALFNPNGFANIYDENRRQLEKIPYGFTNLDEFLAEAFSNYDFQQTLKSISTTARFDNLWKKFVNAIKRMLGITVKDNVLERVLELSKGIMSNTDRSRGGTQPVNANPGPQSRMQKLAQMRQDAKDSFEKMFKEFEVKHFGEVTLDDKDFNKKTNIVNKVLNVPNNIQENTVGRVTSAVSKEFKKLAEKNLQSKSKLFRTIAKTINSVFANAGKNHEDILQSEKFAGEGKVRSVADSVHLDKQLRALIDNNANSLARIQQVLDPEFYKELSQDEFNDAIENEIGPENFAKIKQDDLIDRYAKYREQMGFDEPDYKVIEYDDLSPEEKQAYDAIRFTYDMMHELNFYLGKITPETYEANKGIYSARLYKAYEIPEETKELFKASPYKIDESLYMARTDVNEWKLFNRLADPIYAVTKRLQQTMANKAIIDYADYIYKNKPDAVSIEERPGYRKLKFGYGALSNKYVRDDVAEDFIGYFYASEGMQHFYDFAKKYDKLPMRQFYKKLFTVYNPSTHTGNILGNIVFAQLTGVNPVRLVGNVNWALKQAKDYSSEYRYLLSNGVLQTDFTKEDLVKSITELEQQISTASKSKNPLKFISEKMQKFYSGTDDIFKMAAFKSLLDLGNDPKTAADKVKEGFQNYKRVGKSYDLFSKMPLIGNPFGKFAGDVMRITKNGLINHPLSTMTFLFALKMMSDWSSKLSGESDEERKIRMSRKGMPKIPLPDWAGGDIPLAYKVGDAEWNVARFLSPLFTYGSGDGDDNYEFFSKLLPQNLEVPDWQEIDKGSGLNVFISKNANDPLLAPLVQLLSNSDFRGAPIIDPAETKFKPSSITSNEKIVNSVNFLARGYIPYYNTGNDFLNAVTGDKDYYGRERKPWQVIVSFLGVMPKISDFPKTRYGKIMEQKMTNYGYQFKTEANIINQISKQYRDGEIKYEVYKERIADRLQKQAEIKQKAAAEYKELTNKMGGEALINKDLGNQKKRQENF